MSYTLASTSDTTAETVVRNSRFIAVARRINDEGAARAFVEQQQRQYPDARHHCYAYVIGDAVHDRVERSSDDGEPGGTAGVPMLQVLHHRDLVNLAVVVIRYFGGIKLGAGGLVRAYTGAVTAALDTAPLVERVRGEVFTLAVDHSEVGRIESELRARSVSVLGTEYQDQAVLTLATNDSELLHALVAAATSGSGELEPAGVIYTDR
ncbi:MAG: YigZ family protein [Rhodococcus sp.]|nr:YigZ family protein [Rhodococcus sp. (in: high G+C Gram-positive bacteria)]